MTLNPPAHICGFLGRWASPKHKAERARWIANAQAAGHSNDAIIAALGVTRTTGYRLFGGGWKPNGMKVPVQIRGVTYPSMAAAARAIGVHCSVVQKALESGRLETVGLRASQGERRKGNSNARRVPLVAFGASFPSRVQAARALGVDKSTLTRWLKRDPDRLAAAIIHWRAAEDRRAA